MRRREPIVLDPETQRDLDALDAALAGERDADAALALLVADVRGAAPAPRPRFRAELDERVAAGFPRGRRHRALARIPLRVAAPALGLAAAALVALVVATSGGGGGRSTGESTAVSSAGGQSAPAVRGPLPPVPGPVAPPASTESTRRVERSASLALTTSAGRVQDVADQIVQTAQAIGGYVESSSVSTTPSDGSASFLLRVPAAQLPDALARLSRLAHVASLEQASTDVTGSYDALVARLSDARAERAALLRALAQATTTGEIASLRARLAIVRSRIGALQRELDGLRGQTQMASVQVTVTGHRQAAAPPAHHPWTPADALRDAVRVLEVAAGVLLVGGAALLPLALLGAAAAGAARALRRRRREQALDAA